MSTIKPNLSPPLKDTSQGAEEILFISNSSNLSEIRSEERSLQDKYFANTTMSERMLSAFSRSLREKIESTTMVKSADGGTGFTFLCTLPTTIIPEEKNPAFFGIVLKWQREGISKIEQLGSKIFKNLGFDAPQILFAEKKTADQLSKFASEKAQSMSSLSDEMSLIVMPKLNAMNLGSALKNRRILQMGEKSQVRLIQEFGKIAAIDLLIGNYDRFLSFSSDPSNPFREPRQLNAGNIMFELDGTELMEVYPIDNCTASDLFPKKEEDLETFNVGGFLFDEYQSDSSSESEKEKTSFESKILGYHNVFKVLYQIPQICAQQFKENLITAIHEMGQSEKDYSQFLESVEENFSIGMIEEFKNIQKNPGKIEALLTNESDTHSMKELITNNLKTLMETAL